MKKIEVLEEAARRVYNNVKHLPGTEESAGDFGRGAGGDISRGIDVIAEKTVLDYLKEVGFSCTVIGEECGRLEISDNPQGFLIMDAVDGSTNAVRGIPFSCCSLAFATEEKISAVTDAVIIDLYRGDLYSASRGGGAFVNGKKITVHAEKPLYFVVGVDLSGISSEALQEISPIISASNHIRHFGAVALELAIFARGLVDLFVDLRQKLRVTDVAAGFLIASEAGGIIVDRNCRPIDSDLGHDRKISFIAAASRKILDETIEKLGL